MDASKFTTKTQDALSAAIRQAGGAGNPDVRPVHILLALLSSPRASPCRCSKRSAPTSGRSPPPPGAS